MPPLTHSTPLPALGCPPPHTHPQEELAERASWLLAEEEVLLMEQQAAGGAAGDAADAAAAARTAADTRTAAMGSAPPFCCCCCCCWYPAMSPSSTAGSTRHRWRVRASSWGEQGVRGEGQWAGLCAGGVNGGGHEVGVAGVYVHACVRALQPSTRLGRGKNSMQHATPLARAVGSCCFLANPDHTPHTRHVNHRRHLPSSPHPNTLHALHASPGAHMWPSVQCR